MFKNVKWSAIITAALYIASGALLFIYPQLSETLICDVIGIAVIVWGLIHITSYFMMDLQESLFRNDFTEGVIMVLIGILVIYQKLLFQQLVPFLLSIVIIASGIMKLQDGIDAHRIGFPNGWIYLVLASVSIVFGLVIMFNLIPAGQLVFKVLGAGLFYSGITDLFSALYLSAQIKKYRQKNDEVEPLNPEPETASEQPEPVFETQPETVQPAMNFDPDTGEPIRKEEEQL